MGVMRYLCKTAVENREDKRKCGISRRRWKDNIRIYLKDGMESCRMD
jgi:hypothetical protein